MFRTLLRLFAVGDHESDLQPQPITEQRQHLPKLADDQLKSAARQMRGLVDVVESFALTTGIAERVLGLRMFDVQILGALAMQRALAVSM